MAISIIDISVILTGWLLMPYVSAVGLYDFLRQVQAKTCALAGSCSELFKQLVFNLGVDSNAGVPHCNQYSATDVCLPICIAITVVVVTCICFAASTGFTSFTGIRVCGINGNSVVI